MHNGSGTILGFGNSSKHQSLCFHRDSTILQVKCVIFYCCHRKLPKTLLLKTKYYLLVLCVWEVPHGSHWLKSRWKQSCFLSWRLYGRIIDLPFPASEMLPTFLGSWLLLLIFKGSIIAYFWPVPVSSTFCNYIEPTWIIQGNLPISRSSN